MHRGDANGSDVPNRNIDTEMIENAQQRILEILRGELDKR